MMGTAERLTYMANQIARNFATLGDAGAAAATAEHIASFWDPRMKAQILARVEDPDHGLEPSAFGAIGLLLAGLAATGSDDAGRSMEDRVPATRRLDFSRIKASGGGSEAIKREIAVESPVSLEFNGIGYAVLMATPDDLGDLVYGFALAERLIDHAADIVDFDSHALPTGMMVRVTLVSDCFPRIEGRIRHRISESSCGLCGIENLEQALRPLPRLSARSDVTDAAIFRALDGLSAHQALNRATGAVHAAAACSAEGEVLLVREDVGRHNAFDKLIGAMLRAGASWDGGFALLSSRCSYELVEKAVLAKCPLLATISAPTSLAVERAAAAGLALRVLARPDAVLACAGDAA